jgi:hypothetical protein
LNTTTGIAPPTDVIIGVEGGDIVLSWDEVAGATSYNVYSRDLPFGGDQTWNLEASGITDTTWSEPHTGESKFYCITAEGP